MKIFLAGIIQGSLTTEEITPQDWRGSVSEILRKHLPNAELYCHYTAHPESMTYDGPKIRATFEDGLRRATESDVVLCWLPSASMGTAIEMYEAFHKGAIVLTVTPMTANWVIRLYSHTVLRSLEDLDAFLASGGLDELRENR